jgi:plasmid stabilization system protein ParE
MAFRLTWSPAARLDLRDLRAYIAEHDPSAAHRLVRGVFQAVDRLTSFPESGRVVPEFGDATIREVIRSPCRIVYRVKADQNLVEIARVWHAARGTPLI